MEIRPKPSEWVLQSFEKLRQENPHYSLRSLARDLKMNPSHLSQFLKGKEGLSLEKAHRISEKFKWPATKSKKFFALVEMEFARSQNIKINSAKRWKQLSHEPQYQLIQKDSFAFISDWYHMAILELPLLIDFSPKVSWIAEQLNLTEAQVKEALSRLERLELIRYIDDEHWAPIPPHSSTGNDVESLAIQNFHLQISKLFQQKLSQQNLKDREAQAFVFAVSKEKIPILKEKIRIFCHEVMTELNTEGPKDSLYALAIQLFDLRKLRK